MLAGGGMLFVSIVVLVLTVLRGDNNTPPTPQPAVRQPAPTADTAAEMSDATFLAAAEPLAQRFLSATSTTELLPMILHPQITEPRLRESHPDGKVPAPGMAVFNATNEVSRKNSTLSVQILTDELDTKQLTFFTTPDGLKIDWESWVGWSEMPWDEFLATKPTVAKLFRVQLSQVDYYNFAFADERKWQSYLLESPDGQHIIYGYVERNSRLDNQLRPPPDASRTPVTVTLSFPPNATTRNQVLVGKLLADGWTLETEDSP